MSQPRGSNHNWEDDQWNRGVYPKMHRVGLLKLMGMPDQCMPKWRVTVAHHPDALTKAGVGSACKNLGAAEVRCNCLEMGPTVADDNLDGMVNGVPYYFHTISQTKRMSAIQNTALQIGKEARRRRAWMYSQSISNFHGPSFTCLATRMQVRNNCGTVNNIDHQIAELGCTQFRVRSVSC